MSKFIFIVLLVFLISCCGRHPNPIFPTMGDCYGEEGQSECDIDKTESTAKVNASIDEQPIQSENKNEKETMLVNGFTP